MNALRQFIIPIRGLQVGQHEFEFSIGNDFFTCFEESPIQEGKFDIKCILDKRYDMMVFTFDFKGSMKTDCDRCLANIDMPMKGIEDLIVKYAEADNEDGEIVYITKERSELNIAKYIYEYICLTMPVTNVYDCESEEENVCDLEMLKYLDQKENDDANKDEPKSSPWDALKDLDKNNN